MNKKGLGGLIDIPLGLIGFFVLILVCVSLISIQTSTISPDDMTSTLSKVENETLSNFVTSESNGVIINVIYSFAGFMIYSAMEVSKAAINYGVAHPEVVNPKTLLWLVILALLAPIIIALVRLILVIVILIKDIVQSRKEKRRLEKLRHGY